MTWREVGMALGEARRVLPILDDAATFQMEMDWALQIPEAIQCMEDEAENVEASIRAFVRSGVWPEMSPNERLFALWRIEAGVALTDALGVADLEFGLEYQPPDEEDLIEWAAIESWPAHGINTTIHRLDTLARGFAAGIRAGSPDRP